MSDPLKAKENREKNTFESILFPIKLIKLGDLEYLNNID
jgi:hypothetical protein